MYGHREWYTSILTQIINYCDTMAVYSPGITVSGVGWELTWNLAPSVATSWPLLQSTVIPRLMSGVHCHTSYNYACGSDRQLCMLIATVLCNAQANSVTIHHCCAHYYRVHGLSGWKMLQKTQCISVWREKTSINKLFFILCKSIDYWFALSWRYNMQFKAGAYHNNIILWRRWEHCEVCTVTSVGSTHMYMY